jgi:hypothetical protein
VRLENPYYTVCLQMIPENSGGRTWISKEFGRKIFQECPIPEKTKKGRYDEEAAARAVNMWVQDHNESAVTTENSCLWLGPDPSRPDHAPIVPLQIQVEEKIRCKIRLNRLLPSHPILESAFAAFHCFWCVSSGLITGM